MKLTHPRSLFTTASSAFLFIAAFHSANSGLAQMAGSDQPYKLIQSVKVGGEGGWDYVYADSDSRRLYIPRGDRITVYDLDTLAPVTTIPGTKSVHGVVVDTASHHGFSSSNPLVMWDTQTMAVIKTIDVTGGPDGILFEPATERVYVLSHRDPNVTVVDAKTGDIVGTIDLSGEPEQAASDGAGHVYIDLENRDSVAVVDAQTLKVTGRYDLGGKGGGPGGLAIDAQNHILFAFCHEAASAVILSATDGHILKTLPIGQGVDAAEFNPATGEAFSSQGDGTLTVIKEDGPTQFHVEQTVSTRSGARTSTLDAKTGHILLVTADRVAAPPPAAAPATPPPEGAKDQGRRRGKMQMVPDSFTILVVGK
jgi:DNA-binding beta-propeller fold protein YncE